MAERFGCAPLRKGRFRTDGNLSDFREPGIKSSLFRNSEGTWQWPSDPYWNLAAFHTNPRMLPEHDWETTSKIKYENGQSLLL